jgi:hypothetical protein
MGFTIPGAAPMMLSKTYVEAIPYNICNYSNNNRNIAHLETHAQNKREEASDT